MARSKILAFVQPPVEQLLHAGRPEGERHHADQKSLRQEKEAKRKSQEADLVERTRECHHGKDGAEHEEKRENRKEERLPTVTIASRDQFVLVIADYGTALVAVLLAAWFIRPSGLTPAAWWLTAGVAVAVVAGLIQWAHLAPHVRFNHNDLFHVVQMASLYLLYRGGLLLRDMQ